MRYLRGTIVAAATVAGVAGVLALNPNGTTPGAPATVAGADGDAGGESSGGSSTSGPAPEATPSTEAAPASATYTGDAYPTRWGSIQVAATVTDGVLTDISFVSLPQDSRSLRINQWAAPALVEEALEVQSADVDTISGATYTSEGFRYSLLSILEQAGL
jgi:uncharacterized protein with FMN-binding domain